MRFNRIEVPCECPLGNVEFEHPLRPDEHLGVVEFEFAARFECIGQKANSCAADYIRVCIGPAPAAESYLKSELKL